MTAAPVLEHSYTPRGTARVCDIDGCGKSHVARGMCSLHYNRWQRLDGGNRPRCSIGRCEGPALKRGWCDMHYQRWKIHGFPERVSFKLTALCAFGPCRRISEVHGLCESHHDQRVSKKKLIEIRPWRSHLERDEDGRKLCRQCATWLPEDDFGKSGRNPDGLNQMCRKCGRDRNRLAKYGITWEQYQDLLTAQNGGCAICGGVNTSGRLLAVDHDHACCPSDKTCGQCVRGLLCSNCNMAIGLLKEDAARMRAAVGYLSRTAATR